MRYRCDAQHCRNFDLATRSEWVLTNGIGGYAMGTVTGVNTRRYHGQLVAATDPPATRYVLLANMEATIQGDGNPIGISCNQYQGAVHPEGYQFIESFECDNQSAQWEYKVSGMELVKSLTIHPGENAVTLRYRNTGKGPIGLTLRPLVCHKFYHHNFRMDEQYPAEITFPKNKTVVSHQGVNLYLSHAGAQRVPMQGWYFRFEFIREMERGLDPRDDLYCPCELRYELSPGEEAVLVASTHERTSPLPARELDSTSFDVTRMLTDASEHFVVKTKQRKTILAGYPWFTDWGRDTMISIPGICLATGNFATARGIISDYLSQMDQGLIPNRFVEDGEKPEYNTVDATLWCANAIYLTLQAEWDNAFAKKAFDGLKQVFDWHIKGTHYGIRVDPADGLLRQGEEGFQLTWMDAKVGDWVVTPRHGKPIEVNGLWINTLRVMEWLAEKLGKAHGPFTQAAEHATANFDQKFWKDTLGYYLDTVEPDDGSLRPNQILAMSLPFSPIHGERAQKALDAVSRELLTPVGLRTLSPKDSQYLGRYQGALGELDAAYHQGTVWPWLLGPYVSCLLKVTGNRAEAKRILKPAKLMLSEYGLGGIAEVYDGDEPRKPGGCPWQAWSVAEILRAWLECTGKS